jgi:hypothetical protein
LARFSSLTGRPALPSGAYGSLPARRVDQLTAPAGPGMLPAPGGQVINARELVISGAAGSGIFMYSPSRGKGNLVLASSPVTGTDPYGNTFPAGTNFGTWSAAGQLGQHFGISLTGDIFLATGQPNADTKMFGRASDGSLFFNNNFGATVMLLDPALGGLFFYQDLGSATQGGTIGANVWATHSVVEPINGSTQQPGLTQFDPIAAGFSSFTPGNLFIGNAASMGFLARLAGVGGTGPNNPFLALAGPSASTFPNDAHAIIIVEGTAPDRSSGPQIVASSVVGNAEPVAQTNQFFEVQGSAAVNSIEAIVAGVAETWHSVTSGFPAGWSGHFNYRRAAEIGMIEYDFVLQAAAGTVITQGEVISTPVSGIYLPVSNKELWGIQVLGPAFNSWPWSPAQVNTGGNLLTGWGSRGLVYGGPGGLQAVIAAMVGASVGLRIRQIDKKKGAR